MDIKSILPLLMNMNGNSDKSAIFETIMPQLKGMGAMNPAIESLLKMSKGQSTSFGLAPIKSIANNEIIGMLTKYFS